MKNGRMALCLVGGYLLGRFHKMRWALGLAGVAAGRRLRGSGGGALGDLLKAPALDQLQHLRGELLAAGRTAAVAMASNRIDALSDRLQERAASLRAEPSGERPEAAEETGEAEGGEEAEEREPRRERRGSEGAGREAAERDREITRRRADRLRARSSGGGTRRTTQTSRGARRTAASERSGGRPGREGSAAGEPPRRSRG